MPADVKLLPGQLLGIQQTVRESRPPPLPHRLPLPSFESPALDTSESTDSTYAHIDEFDLDPSVEEAPVTVKQPAKAEAKAEAAANIDPGR